MEQHNEKMVRILRDMCSGSAEAFDLFYNQYAAFVLQLSLHYLGDRMEAEDLCHDLFLEVLRKGERYDPGRGSITSWLAVMTRCRCMDRLRRKQRIIMNRAVEEHAAVQQIAQAAPEEQVVERLQKEAIMRAMDNLPAEQRQALAEVYLAAKTQRELAQSLQAPLGTVKSWIRYGLQNLRKQLTKQGWTEEQRGEIG